MRHINSMAGLFIPVFGAVVFCMLFAVNGTCYAADAQPQTTRGDAAAGSGTLGPNQILRTTPKGEKRPPTTNPTEPKPQPTTQPAQPEKKEEKKPPQQQQPQQQGEQPQKVGQSDRDIDYDEEFQKGTYGNTRMGAGNCKCEGLKALQETAVKETLAYYNRFQPCINGGATAAPKFMAINDYTHETGCMYIINPSGACEKAFDAAYGTGSNRGGNPVPGCIGGSLATPSGFHVTATHEGARYNSRNSLLLADLQGQGSAGRGILIHAGSCDGGACTWGCTGVSSNGKSGDEAFAEVQGMLPPGSLVHNYFGPNSGCHQRDVCLPHGRSGVGSSGSGSAGASGPGSSGKAPK